MVQVEREAGQIAGRPAYRDLVAGALSDRRAALTAALRALERQSDLADTAAEMIRVLRRGNKVMAAGNGGSAAEAQHFAAELVGRFQLDRAPYAALALSTDTSIVTAVANDYGYDEVFARQVNALGRPGDMFVAFSTSGESENLVRAAVAANQRGISVVAVTGDRSCRLQRLARFVIPASVADTAAIQEIHMVVTHVLCALVERELAAEQQA